MVGLAAMRKLCRPPVLILLEAALLLNVAVADGRRMTSRVRIGMDGGYSDILVEVSQDLPKSSCRTILANLKVRTIYTYHHEYILYNCSALCQADIESLFVSGNFVPIICRQSQLMYRCILVYLSFVFYIILFLQVILVL